MAAIRTRMRDMYTFYQVNRDRREELLLGAICYDGSVTSLRQLRIHKILQISKAQMFVNPKSLPKRK